MGEVTQQNVALVEEASAAADALSSQANNLKQMVSFFTLAKNPGPLSGNATDVFVSGSSVRSIWFRNDQEKFKKRLKALKAKVANDGIILSDAQVAALEKKKHDDEACGEIEKAHPSCLGSQGAFYVGNLKGIGRIYQQTFIDAYSKIAFCKLYTTNVFYRSSSSKSYRCCAFLQIAEQSIAVVLINMISSSIWHK